MTQGGAWLIEWAPHVLFAAVLMGGVLIIRRRRGRGALPLFALILLLACVSSFMLARAMGSTELGDSHPGAEGRGR